MEKSGSVPVIGVSAGFLKFNFSNVEAFVALF
jgi:hypothetical protein